MTTDPSPGGGEVDVATYRGDDGAIVVEIDTPPSGLGIRVYVNDGRVFSASNLEDPETYAYGVGRL